MGSVNSILLEKGEEKMRITYWIQKPMLKIGIHRWDEMSGKQQKAITIFFIFIGITIYYGKGKYYGMDGFPFGGVIA